MAEELLKLYPDAEDRDEVVRLLEDLPIGVRKRKYALYEWCRWVGCDLRAEDVERVTGLPAGEV